MVLRWHHYKKKLFGTLIFYSVQGNRKAGRDNAICYPATQAVKAGSDGKTTCLHFPFSPSIMQIAVTPLPLNLLSALSWELSLIRGRLTWAHSGYERQQHHCNILNRVWSHKMVDEEFGTICWALFESILKKQHCLVRFYCSQLRRFKGIVQPKITSLSSFTQISVNFFSISFASCLWHQTALLLGYLVIKNDASILNRHTSNRAHKLFLELESPQTIFYGKEQCIHFFNNLQHTHTTVQKLRCINIFERSLLCSPRLHFL